MNHLTALDRMQTTEHVVMVSTLHALRLVHVRMWGWSVRFSRGDGSHALCFHVEMVSMLHVRDGQHASDVRTILIHVLRSSADVGTSRMHPQVVPWPCSHLNDIVSTCMILQEPIE
eukprot:gnl/TRDRNA2_/TRDRNA2_170246_c7_seq1.p1 gnl/TRDRNA2_/TRDRNA2_170246_c7~~gnl/TRDRNA2_/TRDRNA2_170246_c7_seq1.p1  ORF type:complete len:116 (-),score=5.09 gnl/TRDRNA2_/TRDRNA2_170246_c7_seq1:120-467(-)